MVEFVHFLGELAEVAEPGDEEQLFVFAVLHFDHVVFADVVDDAETDVGGVVGEGGHERDVEAELVEVEEADVVRLQVGLGGGDLQRGVAEEQVVERHEVADGQVAHDEAGLQEVAPLQQLPVLVDHLALFEAQLRLGARVGRQHERLIEVVGVVQLTLQPEQSLDRAAHQLGVSQSVGQVRSLLFLLHLHIVFVTLVRVEVAFHRTFSQHLQVLFLMAQLVQSFVFEVHLIHPSILVAHARQTLLILILQRLYHTLLYLSVVFQFIESVYIHTYYLCSYSIIYFIYLYSLLPRIPSFLL